MFTLLTAALAKTLASYLFGNYLKAHYGSVEIDGAPSWYAKEPTEAICISTYRDGGLDKLELTKNDSKIKLRKKVQHIINVVIYKNFKNLTPDENYFISTIAKDKKLSLFVDANMKFQNIKVDSKINKVFVRSCLDKEGFIKYEKNRMKELQKDLVYYKSDKAFKDLENQQRLKSGRIDKAFQELNNSEF